MICTGVLVKITTLHDEAGITAGALFHAMSLVAPRLVAYWLEARRMSLWDTYITSLRDERYLMVAQWQTGGPEISILLGELPEGQQTLVDDGTCGRDDGFNRNGLNAGGHEFLRHLLENLGYWNGEGTVKFSEIEI